MNAHTHLLKHLTLAALLLASLAASPARAETTQCTAITSLPYTISTQGVYCFTKHLATNMSGLGDYAIEILVNNVTIDLNGWKLGGLAGGTATRAHGIYADQRKNITIKNGSIRGFYYGIYLDDNLPYTTSQGHLIEDIRAEQNTYAGILVQGRGNIVRRNQVVDTGGSTAFANMPAYGIMLYGPGVRALDNDIIGTVVTGTGGTYGLYLNSADGAVAEGNRIADTSAGGSTIGMYIGSSSDVLAAANRITSADNGIYYSASGSGSSGKYMDNLTSSVTMPFFGGTAVGTSNS